MILSVNKSEMSSSGNCGRNMVNNWNPLNFRSRDEELEKNPSGGQIFHNSLGQYSQQQFSIIFQTELCPWIVQDISVE